MKERKVLCDRSENSLAFGRIEIIVLSMDFLVVDIVKNLSYGLPMRNGG